MAGFTLNGEAKPLDGPRERPLLEVLRETHGLTGTKLVCGAGVCGACTVLVDGKPAVSCLMPASAVAGRSVTTVEGIGAGLLHPVQKAFMANDALQCGFCTPGFIVEAVAFHDRWRGANGASAPGREEIASALAGHLCRCGAYAGIYRAVAEACAGKFDAAEGSAPRVEAHAKVTGAAKYTVDIKLPGQLEGAILRSPLAHARVRRIDCAPALAAGGVAAAEPLVEAGDVVRYFGEPVAAVAAADLAAARAALARIEVDYEPLPSAIGYDAARAPGAAQIYSGFWKNAPSVGEGLVFPTPWKGNLRGPSGTFSLKPRQARSMIAAARRRSDPLLVEGVWRTEAQCHTSFEPHAAVARFEGDRLVVNLSTQAAAHLASGIAKHFRLPAGSVRVVAEHVGGGFGSKLGVTAETIAAVSLARAAKVPVRVVFDRHEELSVAGYRPGAELAVALLPSASGDLKAMSVRATADTGVGVSSAIAMLGRMIYTAEAKELLDYDAVSNLPPGAPFRGPGGPVLCFALEQAVDEAAERLKVDPIALRRRWDSDANRRRLYDWAAQLPVWRERQPAGTRQGRYRRGVGVAAGNWLYFWHPGAEIGLAVRQGRLVASMALQDMGTGSRSLLASTVAGAFGLEAAEVEVRLGDSALPHGPISGGSRTTPTIVPVALAAAERLKSQLRRRTRGRVGDNAPWRDIIASSPDLAVTCGRPEDSASASPDAHAPFAALGLMGTVLDWVLRHFGGIRVGRGAPGAVHVAEVEVDTWLGHVRVRRVFAGLCVGRPQAPMLARSQAEGSIVQGIGYALYEGRQIDDATGAVLTAGLEDYRIPGIADVPEMLVHFDEGGFDHVPGGGVGIGEISTLPVAAAVANAIHHAIGQRPRQLPIRPDRVLALLEAGRAA
jgi:xanthine dehydrogenase YagR molybdenum-binding subunit